jgi:hypothetical protein
LEAALQAFSYPANRDTSKPQPDPKSRLLNRMITFLAARLVILQKNGVERE